MSMSSVTFIGAGGGSLFGTSKQNGGGTTFTIAHGLSTTPRYVNVQSQSADALGPFFTTVNSTNITVTYGVATPAGTNNIILFWQAIP